MAKIALGKLVKVSSVFRYFDQGSKGYITFKEFADKACEFLGKFYSDEFILAMFNWLDSDKDGQLKYLDFVNLC